MSLSDVEIEMADVNVKYFKVNLILVSAPIGEVLIHKSVPLVTVWPSRGGRAS